MYNKFAPTADTLFLLVLSILTLESVHFIRFLYQHFLSGITTKSLNTFYHACSYAKVDYSHFMNITAKVALRMIPDSLATQPIFLCVDGTMVAKAGTRFENVSKLFDHAAHNGSNYLNGHCFVRLVIIDPVQAFIGADVDMNRANKVRPVFRKLGMIAEKTGCAIVLIGHLNKSSGTQSTYRGLGSIDIMAAVRSLIFIGKVRKDPTTRVLIHEKSSLAPPGETMAFKLGDEEGFRWVGAYEISADELLDGKEGKATETKLERGRKLIRELLADKKEISIRELDEKAKEQGISGRTMRDVRSRMKNELEYQVNEKQENSIRLKE